MKVVVIGAAGLIGSHLCRLLLKEGFDVRAIVRPNGHRANLDDIHAQLEIVEADIRDLHTVTRVLAGCHICYHTAALVSHEQPFSREYFSTNVQGTMTLCRAALSANLEKFIYTSSCVVFGHSANGEIINESHRPRIDQIAGDYGKSKFLSEEPVIAAIHEGLPAIILNPTLVIGAGDVNTTPGGALLLRYINKKLPAYFKTGFNLIDVRDVATGHLQACRHGKIGENYLLAHHNIMMNDFFQILKELTGIPPPRIRLPYWLASAGALCLDRLFKLMNEAKPTLSSVKKMRHPYFFDSTKAEHELHWRPHHCLKESLSDAISWYRSNHYL